jgi:hypothetical protein
VLPSLSSSLASQGRISRIFLAMAANQVKTLNRLIEYNHYSLLQN